MITRKQKKHYTELHDRLGDVYLLREEQKKKLVEYYAGFRKFLGDSIETVKAKTQIESINPIMDVALEMAAKENLEILQMIKKMSERYYQWITAGLEINNEIMKMMETMIEYNSQLSSPDSTPEMAEELLTNTEKVIIELENKIKPFDKEFEVHQNEYANLRKVINKKSN